MRKIVTAVFVLVCAIGLTGCYVTRQAVHHNNLFNSRRPLTEVIADPGTSKKTKTKLQLTQRILAYAKATGLNTGDAYSYYIDTGKESVSYLVQAAWKTKLKSKKWWFPFVGSVPYLGFFNRPERDEEELALKEQGYDTYKSNVGAFSSLGWFSDPVFSSMIRRDEADLAHLYFHELTHRTVWISGSTRFNENLAEYVADVMTPLFLEHIGKPEMVTLYKEEKQDTIMYKKWLKSLRKDLEAYYDNAEKSKWEDDKIIAGRDAVFAKHLANEAKPNFKHLDYISRKKWNNATVMAASLYQPDLDRFAAAHKCSGLGLIEFLEALEDVAGDFDDQFAALDSFCKEKKL